MGYSPPPPTPPPQPLMEPRDEVISAEAFTAPCSPAMSLKQERNWFASSPLRFSQLCCKKTGWLKTTQQHFVSYIAPVSCLRTSTREKRNLNLRGEGYVSWFNLSFFIHFFVSKLSGVSRKLGNEMVGTQVQASLAEMQADKVTTINIKTNMCEDK